MTAMANLIFLGIEVAAIGPGPGWRRPPKTRGESLGTFRSYLTLLHFSETLDRENHVLARGARTVELARRRCRSTTGCWVPTLLCLRTAVRVHAKSNSLIDDFLNK
eukprot:COSAG02_NODE_10_length_59045_cov_19.973365_12_plen_106_part_00